MFKTLLKHVGEYRKSTILTPILSMLEVFMEILIPYVIALIIDRGISQGSLSNILVYGALMLVIAFTSLFFGVSA